MSGSSSTTRISAGCVVSGGIHDGGPSGPRRTRVSKRDARTVERGGTVALARPDRCARRRVPSAAAARACRAERASAYRHVRHDGVSAHDSRGSEQVHVLARPSRRAVRGSRRGRRRRAERWTGSSRCVNAWARRASRVNRQPGANVTHISFTTPTVATRARVRGGGVQAIRVQDAPQSGNRAGESTRLHECSQFVTIGVSRRFTGLRSCGNFVSRYASALLVPLRLSA